MGKKKNKTHLKKKRNPPELIGKKRRNIVRYSQRGITTKLPLKSSLKLGKQRIRR